jgi:hypothetical protein
MDSQAHRDKADNILASMAKWDDVADSEALIDAAMHVCTHLLNAILHDRRRTAVTADMIHSDMPPPPEPVANDLVEPLAELRWIENLRAFYVRGSLDTPLGTSARCRAACVLFQQVDARSGEVSHAS